MMEIYLEIGDTLKVMERREGMSRRFVRVQCVEKHNCSGCYFRDGNCESLVCSPTIRIDGKPVIFAEVNEEGGDE